MTVPTVQKTGFFQVLLFGFLLLFQQTLTFTHHITCQFDSRVNANVIKLLAVPVSY